MANGHFGLAGAYGIDPTADNQRWHQLRKAQEAREDRACKWVAGRMVGQTFNELTELTDAACVLAVRHYGRALTADERELMTRACRSLWSGLTLCATIAPTRCLVRHDPHRVEFRAA
jgi:hypothetical protein